ncbi:hypothetical protein ACVOMV_08730 [Mesorhizobium atlanticum]
MECAPGAEFIDGQCQPVFTRRRCPAGTTGRFPDCTPIRRQPGIEINPGILLQQLVPQRQPRRMLQDPTGANIQ